jgi:hypothetical protein
MAKKNMASFVKGGKISVPCSLHGNITCIGKFLPLPALKRPKRLSEGGAVAAKKSVSILF